MAKATKSTKSTDLSSVSNGDSVPTETPTPTTPETPTVQDLTMDEKIAAFLKEKGFSKGRSASFQFEKSNNTYKIKVSYHIGTDKVLYTIGRDSTGKPKVYKDNDMTYYVVETKGDDTVLSISGGGDKEFPINDLKSAIEDALKIYK